MITRLAELTGLPPDRIQHVGSTAVPHLSAKPILDFDLGLKPNEDRKALVLALIEAGFIDRGTGTTGIARLLVWEPHLHASTVHLHLITYRSIRWECDIAFRDALRTDHALRKSYFCLKAKLAKRFPTNRRAYREGKAKFIANALYRIKATDWPTNGLS